MYRFVFLFSSSGWVGNGVFVGFYSGEWFYGYYFELGGKYFIFYLL